MSDEERTPDELLSEWGRQVIPVDDADVAEERKARVVNGIARNIRESANVRKRTSRRARLVIALAAAIVLLVTSVLAISARQPEERVTEAMKSGFLAFGRIDLGALTSAAPAPTSTSTSTPSEPLAPLVTKTPATKIAPSDASALTEQNRVFAAARAATQRGDDKTALGHLNQFLARWPQSPLAPEARVERFRALKRLGNRDEAAKEARRYLTEQKDGPAREEARSLALDPN